MKITSILPDLPERVLPLSLLDQIFRQERGQLTTRRTGNLTRLIHTLAICVTVHTYSLWFACKPFGQNTARTTNGIIQTTTCSQGSNNIATTVHTINTIYTVIQDRMVMPCRGERERETKRDGCFFIFIFSEFCMLLFINTIA